MDPDTLKSLSDHVRAVDARVAQRSPFGNNPPLVCSICHEKFTEYGNNAQPVNDGRCCDACNSSIVVPIRLKRMYAAELERE